MLFSEYTPRRRGALSSFATSLGLHSLVVGLIWTVNPTPRATQFPEPDLAELLEREQRRITWYAPKTALPSVAPAEPTPNPSPAKLPRYQSDQNVVADNPKPLSDRQMIVGEAPEIPIQQDLEIPNMVSWKAPVLERPRYQPTTPKLIAPPRPSKIAEEAPKINATPTQFDVSKIEDLPVLRFRREKKAAEAPQQRRLEPVEAPEIQPQQTQTADASQFSSIAKLRYQSRNEAKPAAPEARALDASGAPILRDAPGTPGLAAVPVEDDLPKLRYQAGDRGRPTPDAPRQRSLAEVGGAAPEIGGAIEPVATAAIPGQDTPRLRYQDRGKQTEAASPQTRALGDVAGGPAPQVDGTAAGDAAAASTMASLTNKTFDLPGAPPPSLGAKGGDASGGTGGDRNLVVVGVDPADKPPAETPKGSRTARFAAGPDGGPQGGQVGAGTETAALRVPNLAIRGNPAPATAATPRRQPGEPDDAFRNLTRTGGFRDLAGAPPTVDATFDAPEIDINRPFVGRPVYTVAINMPNVTSYRGDWVIQFAEWLPAEEARKRQRETASDIEQRLAVKDDDLTPPWPKKKVDPKYIADAVREKVEGEVVLYGVIQEDGSLQDLQVLRSLDERLDQSARAAIAQWVFEPARKDGKTVKVEVLVKIPFRLNPNVKVRY